MNIMKRTAKAIIAAAAAVTVMMSFASCGDTSESSSKSGTVSLVTTTTAAPADSSSEEETTTTTTTAAADSSEAETTTTTSAPDSSEAETTTTTAEAPKEETFADKLKIKYNGTEFSIGDTFADIEKSLGGYSDNFQAAHCTDDGMDDIYVYSGMDVTVFEGKVSNVIIYDNGNYDKPAPETVCGLKTGITDADSILGTPVKTNGSDSKYDCDGLWVCVSMVDGKAYSIMIAELEKAIPEFSV